MPKFGDTKFHGAFGSKSKATAKRKRVGGTIRKIKVRGDTRYLVVTRKRG